MTTTGASFEVVSSFSHHDIDLSVQLWPVGHTEAVDSEWVAFKVHRIIRQHRSPPRWIGMEDYLGDYLLISLRFHQV